MKEQHRVIILNGPSSSGKTTVARALQALLDEPAMRVEHDVFVDLLPEGHFTVETRDEYSKRLEKFFFAVNRATVGLLEGGYDVIVDTVMSHWSVYRDWIALFGTDVLLVGIHCPLDELEKRERARGTRDIGLARRQLRWVHSHGTYDLELDTSKLNPDACAQKIKLALSNPPRPTALQELKVRFERGEIPQAFLWE
jgi:chloramphenicol 3-O phosphotransferase